MGPLLCQSDLFEHAICPLPWSWDMWSLLQQLLQFVLKNKQQENKANTFNRRWKCFISWSNWQHWYFRFVHITIHIGSAQFSSVQLLSRVRLCDPMNCSTPGLPVHHQLPEPTQTHFHWVSDTIQLTHPLLSPSPPAFNLSQHQGLFRCVSFSHQVAKVLEFQLQYHSFHWIFRTDFL